MGKEIVFDYSKTAGFISEEEMKNMKSTVMGAKDVLTAKSGAGNDYLGWIDLPVDYDKEEFARIKKAAEKMFTELTKGQDVQHPTITAEQLTDAMLDSVSGMEGATPEALEQLRNGLLGILQSAAEQENAHEADE